MDSYDYEFYERLKSLITVVRESEQQRLQLEWRLSEWNRPDMKRAKEKACELQTQLSLMKEEKKIYKERNTDLKRRLNEMGSLIKKATSADEKLLSLKGNCKKHLLQEHPNWKKYKEVLQSQLEDALQKINGKSNDHPEKITQPEYSNQSNLIRPSTIDQFAPSISYENNPSSRLQIPPGIYQDPYVIPPEKPQRSQPRIYDEQVKPTNTAEVFSPSMPHQSVNQFTLQDHGPMQNWMAGMQNALLPATIMPVGYPQQEPFMVQVPLGYNQGIQRVQPKGTYLVPNNIQTPTVYPEFQVPPQILIKGGERQMGVPEFFASEAPKEEPKIPKTDPKQQPSSSLGMNGKEAIEVVHVEHHSQPNQNKKTEKLDEFEEEKNQKVQPQHQKCHIFPEETEYHHPTGNATATANNPESMRKQNSFEDVPPVRVSRSPQRQTSSRRLVKPILSDIELTGDFDSLIIYGRTPPTRSSPPPKQLNRRMKSIDNSQLMNASSDVKKETATAAAAEDTDFGILSLPDNLLPPTTAGTRASVSESGQRKTGDMTTADGFDTGVSNSIPGIHLSHSLSNPEERSYISDFETENSPPPLPPPLEIKDMEPTSHPSGVGLYPLNRRQSKKNLRRSSSPVTPALSVDGLLLLMKMVEDSFQSVPCSKDEYYRSFQPSDEERGRILREANNEGALTIDADPSLVSMIILEQMTVIIRSLSTGCLLSDSLLQSENLLNLRESDIKSRLPLDTVNLWESLFVHFSSILKHKVMNPKEVAAVFVPCLLQSGSDCQDKAFKFLVQLLEHMNRNLLSNPMGIDGLSDNSSDEFPIPAAQRHEKPTIIDKPELVTSVERAFSDGMEGDDMEGEVIDLDDEMDKEKSSELNISHTPAYKNMLYGFMGSISVDDDIGNSDSESDDLEKQFGTSIPDTRQTINPTPNSAGKTATPAAGVAATNVPSGYSAAVPSTEDEDSRDYDFYD